MALGIRVTWEPLRELNFAVLNPVYMGVGTRLDSPVRQVLIQNLTDVILAFSWDGVTDHFKLPKRSFYLIDITTNGSESQGLYIAQGDRLYVRTDGFVPTEGQVCLSAWGAIDD